jgi:DNA recombination protein RmuC
MSEMLTQLDYISLLIGILVTVPIVVIVAWLAWRRGAFSTAGEQEALRRELDEANRQLAIAETRREEQQRSFEAQITRLEEAEKRLESTFENTAGKIFEERSRRFTELSEKQLGELLKPLTRDLGEFKATVDASNKEGIQRHAEMGEKLKQLARLNETLHEEAQNLTRALTHDVKAQGNWGEQQLERLMELAGLIKGTHFFTQVSVKGKDGKRLQPDFVLQLPGNTSIVLDSKVSLTDWTRYQSAPDDAGRATSLDLHVRSIKAHIDGLAAKNYTEAEELNAMDFVLMFVPIESALIAALQHDPTLPEYALRNRVALLSPSNFLATARTVASVWQVHNQNTNAQRIADRGGKLYDKFKLFAENLKDVGFRMDQAQESFAKAYRQLSEGPGNLVSQVETLKTLGAKNQKDMDENLVTHAVETDTDSSHLRLIDSKEDDDPDASLSSDQA